RGAGRLRRRPRGARPPARALSRAGPHGRRCPRLCPNPRDDRSGLHDALLRPPFLRRRRGGAGLRGSTHRRRRRGCRRRAAPGGGAPSPRGAHASRPGSLPRGDPQCAPRRGGAGARHEPMARRLIARDVVADGIRIHVVEAGEGPALILLHGLTATHFTWEHTIPAFADRWRVIAPDLPGHGRSEKPDAPYTIDFYAGVCRARQPPARPAGARGLSALRARREPFTARRAGGGTAAARAPVAADAARLGTARPPGGAVRQPPPPARRAACQARRARRLRAPADGRAAGSLQPRGGRLLARRGSLALAGRRAR